MREQEPITVEQVHQLMLRLKLARKNHQPGDPHRLEASFNINKEGERIAELALKLADVAKTLAEEVARLREIQIRPIRTEAEYKVAVARIQELMPVDPALGTPEGDELDMLAALVEYYETKCFMTCRLKDHD
jgi:uncharacterized protein YoaH (UPF0181 family)